MYKYSVLFVLIFILFSCHSENKKVKTGNLKSVDFDPSVLSQEMLPVKTVKGQILYLPVYSNVPYHIDTIKYDMSAFVAVHNTDLTNPIFFEKGSLLRSGRETG